jgi:hypothetical protein
LTTSDDGRDHFAGHGIGKLLVPLVVRPNARKEMSANIARLKQQLERNHTNG